MNANELVELRTLKQGAVFTIPGDDVRYTRGPYSRADRDFLVRDTAAMEHHHMQADALVRAA